jgi:hypothetical protein
MHHHCPVQADLELANSSASAFSVLGFQVSPSLPTPWVVWSLWSFWIKGCPKLGATNVQDLVLGIRITVVNYVILRKQIDFNHSLQGKFYCLWGEINRLISIFLDLFGSLVHWILHYLRRTFLLHPPSDCRLRLGLPGSCAQQYSPLTLLWRGCSRLTRNIILVDR